MLYNLILAQDAAQGGGGLSSLVMIVLLVVVFYFFMIRPQNKKQKEIKKFREGIQKGDKIVTAGGIHGKVRDVRETTFVVEIANGCNITIEKNYVYPSAADAAQSVDNDKTTK